MSNTVTTYYTFVAGTKARASNVNTNFSNHRGDLVPINSDTASASDNSHDLGTSDHRWRTAYLGRPVKVNNVYVNCFPIEMVWDGTNPANQVEDIGDVSRVPFTTEADHDYRFGFVVPPQYVPGDRISLNIKGYCDTTGIFVMRTVAGLYQNSVTNASLTAPANQLTSLSTITAQATANQFFDNTTLRLTSASGQINGVAVAVGDRISVNIARLAASDAADVNAGSLFLTDIMVDLNN